VKDWLLKWSTAVPPASGAAVMSTGILSIAFYSEWAALSRVLLALALLSWGALAALFVVRLSRHRHDWLAAARSPTALTAVAATAVIGGRVALIGWRALAWALLAVSTGLLLGLLPLVLRRCWPRPTTGAGFLTCVAAQSIATLSAALASFNDRPWTALLGLVAFVAGIALYVQSLRRFAWSQLVVGAGDQWVLGGALAISSLAGAQLLSDAQRANVSGPIVVSLRVVDVVLWALALALYVAAAIAEVMRPRLRYDVRRWATVFPLGMVAVASSAVGRFAEVPAARALSGPLAYLGMAVWMAVAAGAVGHSSRLVSRGHTPVSRPNRAANDLRQRDQTR
jgi:tellurite resistance protein TehA-like permease